MKLALFAYDFPHKRSQDFLSHLLASKYSIEVIVLTPKRYIDKPEAMRVKPIHTGLIEPSILYNNTYEYLLRGKHNCQATINMLKEREIDIGIISGACILRKEVIDACKIGIINVHPGLIPHTRGQDSLKWAVYKNLPLGITAHLIDERVDAGSVLVRKRIDVFPDDTWIDLSLRLEEMQPQIMLQALKYVQLGFRGKPTDAVGRANSYFPKELEKELDLEGYKKRFANELGY